MVDKCPAVIKCPGKKNEKQLRVGCILNWTVKITLESNTMRREFVHQGVNNYSAKFHDCTPKHVYSPEVLVKVPPGSAQLFGHIWKTM